MDISKIDINFVEIFDLSYTIALNVFSVEPIAASGKVQKKIRKWVEKNYIAGEAYPQKVMRFIGKDVSDEDFIKFLKVCHDQIQLNGTHKKQLFDKISVGLTQEVKSAIWALLDHNVHRGNIRQVGADAKINVEYSAGYNLTLTLANASYVSEGKIDCLSFENGSLIKQDDEYKLVGEAVNYEEDTSKPFDIRFTDAKVDITLFRADAQPFSGTPWMHLQSVAGAILDKYFLPGDCLNNREKELLPLIIEISRLSYRAYIPDKFEYTGFSQLTAYIAKFGYNELLPLIESLEKNFFNYNKRCRIIKKLLSKLNAQRYEPLWRKLYNILVESQANYPSKALVCSSPELLKETRNNIQKLMRSHGYSGEYPDFVKRGPMRGVHLAESYNMSYFIAAEKNAVYHIHCTEEYFSERLMVGFICGTELLRKNETAGDIYSCLFEAKGRRIFSIILYKSVYVNRNGENEFDDLKQRIQIAVKKAELIKLTKEERKEIVGLGTSYWKLFFLVFIVGGGLFAALMTISFILITIVACLASGEPQTIPSIFTDIPWWTLFLLMWVLFGGAAGIITVLAKRK